MNIGKIQKLKGWWGGFGGFGLGIQGFLKFFVNEVSRVPIGHEGFSKVCSFFIKMLRVRDFNCSSDQSFKDNIFLRRVVMGVGVEVAISVGFFPIHLIRERTTLFSGDQDIKKGNGVTLSNFHGKFNVGEMLFK